MSRRDSMLLAVVAVVILACIAWASSRPSLLEYNAAIQISDRELRVLREMEGNLGLFIKGESETNKRESATAQDKQQARQKTMEFEAMIKSQESKFEAARERVRAIEAKIK